MTEPETLPTPTGPITAHWAVPEGKGPWPGVVVIHDAFGFTNDVKQQTDWFAASGYLAVAPALYSRGNTLACVRNSFRALANRKGQAFDDIEAARAALIARPDCSGKVGVIGFCMGGGFALLAAVDRGFDVSSVNYGMVPDDADALLSGACPIVGSFGGKDRTLKGAAAKLTGALELSGVDHDVVEYPDANHAFLNQHKGVGGWLIAQIGFGYRPQEAHDARARILDFFSVYLHTA